MTPTTQRTALKVPAKILLTLTLAAAAGALAASNASGAPGGPASGPPNRAMQLRHGPAMIVHHPAGLKTGRKPRPGQPHGPMAQHPHNAPHASSFLPPPANPNKISVVKGHITVDGKMLHYHATTGYMPMTNGAGRVVARMFYIAYTKDRPAKSSAARRPITFIFNGGPGASSVWLNLGTAGPTRLQLPKNGGVPNPPYKLVKNHQTWLGATDLVFIDPIDTGYSRAAPGVPPQQFFGVQQDIQSVGSFIRLYLTTYSRWASPKFLAGESYGTTRAAALAQFLPLRYGIALNGVMLLSSVLNFQTIQFNQGNDLPYPLFLPTYTATAWYHHKLPAALQAHFHQTLAKVRRWARTVYAPALAQGAALPRAQRIAIIDKLARYTGLSKNYVVRCNLRIRPERFEQQLLNSQSEIVSRMDTRLTAFNTDRAAGSASYDPGMQGLIAPYTSAFEDYVSRILKYHNLLPYDVLSDHVFPWHFDAHNSYLNVADNLQQAMVNSPKMKILACMGYFDLATPFYSQIYTFNHLHVGRKLQKNVTEKFFMSGHMVYHPYSQLVRLHHIIETFIRSSDTSGAKPAVKK